MKKPAKRHSSPVTSALAGLFATLVFCSGLTTAVASPVQSTDMPAAASSSRATGYITTAQAETRTSRPVIENTRRQLDLETAPRWLSVVMPVLFGAVVVGFLSFFGTMFWLIFCTKLIYNPDDVGFSYGERSARVHARFGYFLLGRMHRRLRNLLLVAIPLAFGQFITLFILFNIYGEAVPR